MILVVRLLQKTRMIARWNNLSPKKRLRAYSISFITVSVLVLMLVFSSLAMTASNLMITNELATAQQLQQLRSEFSLYLISQNSMVAFDVLLLFSLPFLAFSVFTFYTKGNLIIVLFVALLDLVRLIFGLLFVFARSGQKEVWQALWTSSKYGAASECSNQSCGDAVINYVLCGKLALWSQLNSFQHVFCAVWSLLSILQLLLALKANHLDTQMSELEQEQLRK